MKYSVFLFTVLALQVFAAKSPFGRLQEEQKFYDYTVRTYLAKDASSGSFEILRSGRQIYSHDGQFFGVGDVTRHGQTHTNTSIKMGQSITSDKEPNLVVTEWTSGNHCCTTFHIFEIGQAFKKVATLEALYFETSEFRNLMADGNLELVTADWTFAYWNVDCAHSHSPTIILRYQGGRYLPDLKLMKQPPPKDLELSSMAAEFKTKFNDSPVDMPYLAPVEMWQKMLDLIYSGNMRSAWKLQDLSWPADRAGKRQFVKEFKKQLLTSPYYTSITGPTFQSTQ